MLQENSVRTPGATVQRRIGPLQFKVLSLPEQLFSWRRRAIIDPKPLTISGYLIQAN